MRQVIQILFSYSQTEFKHTLEAESSLETWAAWLESVVDKVCKNNSRLKYSNTIKFKVDCTNKLSQLMCFLIYRLSDPPLHKRKRFVQTNPIHILARRKISCWNGHSTGSRVLNVFWLNISVLFFMNLTLFLTKDY